MGTMILLAALLWRDFDPLPLVLWVLAITLGGLATRLYVTVWAARPGFFDQPTRRASELMVIVFIYGAFWVPGRCCFLAPPSPCLRQSF